MLSLQRHRWPSQALVDAETAETAETGGLTSKNAEGTENASKSSSQRAVQTTPIPIFGVNSGNNGTTFQLPAVRCLNPKKKT